MSLYDLPVIFEPSKIFERDFNHTAFFHMNRASNRVKEFAQELLNTFVDDSNGKVCFRIPLDSNRSLSTTPAFNMDNGKIIS